MLKFIKIAKSSLVLILFSLVLLLISSGKTNAFSGPGDGSAEAPFVIANCVQLGEMNNDLSAHYILNNDIDCIESKNWGPSINSGY